jgi:hypothetical protein
LGAGGDEVRAETGGAGALGMMWEKGGIWGLSVI